MEYLKKTMFTSAVNVSLALVLSLVLNSEANAADGNSAMIDDFSHVSETNLRQSRLPMTRDRLHFLLLNIGHFLDHLFTLIFATVAALALYREWGVGYAELLAYATPGFLAFGLFSLPAGWLADRWSRDGMMVVFFIGIGLASIATSFASTPLQIAVGLFVIGNIIYCDLLQF